MTGPPPDPAGVYISAAQMYQEMRSLHEALTRIDAKLDALRDRDAAADEQLADHEARLRTLERRVWTASGAAAAVGGAAGWIAPARGNG